MQDTTIIIDKILQEIKSNRSEEFSLSDETLRNLLEFLWADFDGNRQICWKILTNLMSLNGNRTDFFAQFATKLPSESLMYNAIIQSYPNDYLLRNFRHIPNALLDDIKADNSSQKHVSSDLIFFGTNKLILRVFLRRLRCMKL